MPRKERRRIGTVIAVDDAGRKHAIAKFADFIEIRTLNDPPTWLEGVKCYRMPNGNHVNVLENGTFEDIHTGLKMRPA